MTEHSGRSSRPEVSKTTSPPGMVGALQARYIAFMAIFLGRPMPPGPAIWLGIGLSVLFWALITAVIVHLFWHWL